jgi:type IV secretion system protein VirD4
MYRQVRPYSVWQQLERGFWQWGMVACLVWAGFGLWQALESVNQSLMNAGWGTRLQASELPAVLVSCSLNVVCSKNLELVTKLYDQTRYLSPLLAFAVLGIVAQGFKRYPRYKPVAAGRFATRGELEHYLKPSQGSSLVGTLGLIPRLEWLPKFLWGRWNHLALAIPEDEFNEHSLVYGPPGSGKTAGVFRPMLLRAAIQGRSAIVFDVKYPDARQGLYAVVNEFRMLERSVMVFTPFAEQSQSLDLFAGCEVFGKALEVATVFMPMPAVKTDGSYYENQERRLLAALVMDGKLKGGVRLDELLMRLKGGVKAIEGYIQRNPHLMAELRTFMDLYPDKIAGVMTGLAATLEPYCQGKLPAFLGGHGQSINLEQVFLEPSLLYIGIQQADVMRGAGKLVMQLVKRLVDEVGLRVADASPTGQVPVGTGVYLDELLNLGKLDKLENMLSTLRSRGVAYVLGIHSHSLGRSIYGREEWEAIIKATRHKLVFLGALDPMDALEVSKALGEMTVFEQSVVESDGDNGGRHGSTTREAKRALVSVEEMLTWQQFHAVVISRYLAPFRVFCYPLFDKRHPDFWLAQGIAKAIQRLEPLILPSGELPAHPDPNATPQDSAQIRLEIARIIYRAVEQRWGCELFRERKVVTKVKLEPHEAIEVPNVSGLEFDGKYLIIHGCQRINEDLLNALIWLKRRTELEVWIRANAHQLKGSVEYQGTPLGEIEVETLWMPSGAVAEIFGKASLGHKQIKPRNIDGTELDVIEVRLHHRGLEKLRQRLASLESDAKLEQGVQP